MQQEAEKFLGSIIWGHVLQTLLDDVWKVFFLGKDAYF